MIKVALEGSIARFTLDREHKRNAISLEMIEQLCTEVDRAVDNPDLSVILLDAAGPSFSAGYDLTGRYAEGGRPSDPWTDREHLRRMTRGHEALWNCPLPIVAAVQGACMAGGADLVMHSDFVVMSENAYLAYPPTRFLGTPPSHMWIYRAGLPTARRVLIAGEKISADDALKCGLAHSVVPDDELGRAALDLAARISGAGRELLMSNKWIINRGVDLMGRALLNRVAESEDALSHLSPRSMAFKKRAGEVGVRAALEETR